MLCTLYGTRATESWRFHRFLFIFTPSPLRQVKEIDLLGMDFYRTRVGVFWAGAVSAVPFSYTAVTIWYFTFYCAVDIFLDGVSRIRVGDRRVVLVMKRTGNNNITLGWVVAGEPTMVVFLLSREHVRISRIAVNRPLIYGNMALPGRQSPFFWEIIDGNNNASIGI